MATTVEQIESYMHCAKCGAELPDDQSIGEYARLNVGVVYDEENPSHVRAQVWCRRHDLHVAIFRIEQSTIR